MAANQHLLSDVILGLIGAGGVSIAVGWFLIRQAWNNFCEGRVPLVGSLHLTGFVGRCGAIILLGAGAIAMLTGGLLMGLCLWRLVTWLLGV